MRNLIIDCFAGGGGASVGIEMALGRPVDIAINHDPDAILMHKTNHPGTLLLTEDIFKADLQKYVGSQGACCIIAEYSTKSKAMKVLDMIQEAYGDSEYTKYVIPEVCRILSMKPKTEENKAHAGELGEMLKKGMTFQMPEDSEVVV